MPPFNHFAFRVAALGLLVSAAPAALFVAPAEAQIAVGVSISAPIAPPVLPVYAQPPIPGPGYIWTPGYWAWNGGYYWVPGTWVMPPRVGVLWTPGYWGWGSGVYAFHPGYWGPTVGFYGGINYGFGYGGVGFGGGYWNNGAFNYNTAVTNVGNTHIGNTYNAPVTINRTTDVTNNITRNVSNTNNITRNVSYNGGQGGTTATPTAAQQAYASQQHTPPTTAQVQHQQMASKNPALSYANNKGAPPIAATARPAAFHGEGVTRAANAAPLTQPGNHNPGAATSQGNHPNRPNGQSPGLQHNAARVEQGQHNAARVEQGQHNAARVEQGAAPHPAGPGPGGPHPGQQFAPGPHPGQGFGPGGPRPGAQFAAGRPMGPGPRRGPGPHPGPNGGPHPGGGPRPR